MNRHLRTSFRLNDQIPATLAAICQQSLIEGEAAEEAFSKVELPQRFSCARLTGGFASSFEVGAA